MRKLSAKIIIKLTRFFYPKIIPHLPKSSNRGRPKTYPDWQILAMLLIKEIYGLSFRETIQLSDDEEYKHRNEIEGLFGNVKTKLGGGVMVCREDMAMLMAWIS